MRPEWGTESVGRQFEFTLFAVHAWAKGSHNGWVLKGRFNTVEQAKKAIRKAVESIQIENREYEYRIVKQNTLCSVVHVEQSSPISPPHH